MFRNPPTPSAGGCQKFILKIAHLSEMDLSRTSLWDIDLSGASLRETDLSEANLNQAKLKQANLSGSDLSKADLSNADLSKANLQQAFLGQAKNRDPEQIKSACFWDQAIYEGEWNWNKETKTWEAKNEQAKQDNAKFIEDLKKDKSEDTSSS